MKKHIEAFKRLEATAPKYGCSPAGNKSGTPKNSDESKRSEAIERYYSIREVAESTSFSKRHIERLLDEEVFEDVVNCGRPSTGKRQLRIPESSIKRWIEDSRTF